MKIALRYINSITLILLVTACLSSPNTGISSPLPPTAEPAIVTQPAPTLTASPIPTSTVQPTAYPTIASTPIQPVIGLPQGTDDYPWWNDTVFYEIFVRSFYDSDGDGIGDFNGIIAKLDYLNDGDPNTNTDLGVTGLWLMPINPSPSYHGYDVTDYYAVNPEYGTMDDFKRLVNEAHKRGIRVTIDWVLNHTSSQHPWFQQAREDPTSPYHDWYRWTTESFPGNGWRYGGSGGYYYALFSEGMPDLNYDNPEVVAEMKNVMRFWLRDVGIDGFRLDAAKHIIEDGKISENTPQTHEFYKDLREFYKGVKPDAMLVGEVVNQSSIVSTYLTGEELDLAFNFDLATNILASVNSQSSYQVRSTLDRDISLFRPGQFAAFLTNHDHNRAMSTMNDNVDVAKNAAFLLLTSPGVPYLYYGEEIGMLGMKPDEDIRLPMQWTEEANAGFTTGKPWRSLNSDYTIKNVAMESTDPNSLLSFYRELIRIRNNHAALRVGDFISIDSDHRSVFASLRVSREEIVLVLANLSPAPVSDYALTVDSSSLSGNYMANPLLGFGEFPPLQVNELGGFTGYLPMPEIPANGRIILQLQMEKK